MSGKKPVLKVGPARYFQAGLVIFGRYKQSSEFALQIINEDTGEPEGVAIVALVPYGAPHPGDYGVWLKGWSENTGVPEALEKAGIVRLTGKTFPKGHCRAQHAELIGEARDEASEVRKKWGLHDRVH